MVTKYQRESFGKKKRKKAFTLVELLVVIAIISLLIAMILPALSKAQEYARNTICRSNLKSNGFGLAMYLTDHDNCFPNSYNWIHQSSLMELHKANANWSYFLANSAARIYPDSCRWHNEPENLDHRPNDAGQLYRYISDKDIHVCPSFRKLVNSGLGTTHYRHDDDLSIDPQWSYSINGYLGPTHLYNRDRAALVGEFLQTMGPNYNRDKIPNFTPIREGWGVARKSDHVQKNPSRVFTFAEENIIWDIEGRSRPNEISGINNLLVTRFAPADNFQNAWSTYTTDGSKLLPWNYRGAFATFHLPPSQDLELSYSDDPKLGKTGFAVTANNSDYPQWGLCRGSANAAFLDQHVESMPYTVDTHDYAWPLRSFRSRRFPPFYWQR